MDVLPTRVNRTDPIFSDRVLHNSGLIDTLRDELEKVKLGGGMKYVERHRSRGKSLPRERIQSICDPGTAFLEMSPLADMDCMMVKHLQQVLLQELGLYMGGSVCLLQMMQL